MGQSIRTPTAGNFVADFTLELPRGSVLSREKHSADLIKVSRHTKVTI